MLTTLNLETLPNGTTKELLCSYDAFSNISTWIVVTKDADGKQLELYRFKYKGYAIEYYKSI